MWLQLNALRLCHVIKNQFQLFEHFYLTFFKIALYHFSRQNMDKTISSLLIFFYLYTFIHLTKSNDSITKIIPPIHEIEIPVRIRHEFETNSQFWWSLFWIEQQFITMADQITHSNKMVKAYAQTIYLFGPKMGVFFWGISSCLTWWQKNNTTRGCSYHIWLGEKSWFFDLRSYFWQKKCNLNFFPYFELWYHLYRAKGRPQIKKSRFFPKPNMRTTPSRGIIFLSPGLQVSNNSISLKKRPKYQYHKQMMILLRYLILLNMNGVFYHMWQHYVLV